MKQISAKNFTNFFAQHEHYTQNENTHQCFKNGRNFVIGGFQIHCRSIRWLSCNFLRKKLDRSVFQLLMKLYFCSQKLYAWYWRMMNGLSFRSTVKIFDTILSGKTLEARVSSLPIKSKTVPSYYIEAVFKH